MSPPTLHRRGVRPPALAQSLGQTRREDTVVLLQKRHTLNEMSLLVPCRACSIRLLLVWQRCNLVGQGIIACFPHRSRLCYPQHVAFSSALTSIFPKRAPYCGWWVRGGQPSQPGLPAKECLDRVPRHFVHAPNPPGGWGLESG